MCICRHHHNLPIYFQRYVTEVTPPMSTVQYSSIAALPTNSQGNRLWTFIFEGSMMSTVSETILNIDFSKVTPDDYIISFEGNISGTFEMYGHVYSAKCYIRYTYNFNIKTITLYIKNPRLDTSTLGSQKVFSFQIFINDKGSTNQIFFFKLDQYLSTQFTGEEVVSSDECLNNYLFASLSYGSGIGTDCPPALPLNCFIMRVKIPFTYDTQSTCSEDIDYDVYYYSISSQQAGFDECNCLISEPDKTYCNNMPVWSINASTMIQNSPDQKYCYIFFAPFEYVESKLESPQSRNAPVINWGQYTGPLLCVPTYAWYVRYKLPNPDWIGNTKYAPCYPEPSQNVPLSNSDLGYYVPQLFGSYFENSQDFENSDTIGAINKNEPWSFL
jgi:hypothetical protein